MGALREAATGTLQQLEDAGSGQAAVVVGQLAELDRVKRRMEDACNTLKVSGGWRNPGRACQMWARLPVGPFAGAAPMDHSLCCARVAGGNARASWTDCALSPTCPFYSWLPMELFAEAVAPARCPPTQEAAGLSALFQRVDDYFASGNLARVADALAGIRRGLAVVGDSVVEFRGG